MTAGPAMTPALHHLEQVMGTVVTIDVYVAGAVTDALATALRRQLGQAQAILHDADATFSTWQPGSPVSRLRRGELTVAQAPAEVTEVLARCRVAREVSRGWFDPWAMPGGVDPTGYVKGWAAQRALAAFIPAPQTSAADTGAADTGGVVCGAIVNAAGDIASFGRLADGQPFRIGVTDPAAPPRLAGIIELTGAVATSGTYERGSHLIDPHTGEPAAGAASASVTGPDLGLADALATALAVAGKPGLAMIGPLAGYEALLIGYDGDRLWTPGFPFATLSPPASPLDCQ